MSYDLYFWREESPVAASPEAILQLLDQERPMDGFGRFPNDAVVDAFQAEFPEITFSHQQLCWEGHGSYFHIHFSHSDDNHIHLIAANCGYDLLQHSEVLNRIIDVAHKFGCGMYDPQVPQRYPEPDRVR